MVVAYMTVKVLSLERICQQAILMVIMAISIDQSRANIAVHDGSTAIASALTNTITLPSFSVTAGADVLVVLLEDKGAAGGAVNVEPATLSWGSQTITKAIAQDNPDTTVRGESIYYLYNPIPGTNAVTATLTTTDNSIDITAYSLSGVDTNFAPQTASYGDSTSSNITINVTAVVAGSCAAFDATWAQSSPNPTINCTGRITTISNIVLNDGLATVVSVGDILGLSAGTDAFTVNWAAPAQKNNFAVAVFKPITAINIAAASAVPNLVSVGSPVLLGVMATSTAGSISSVMVNASAIGGPSALPLELSAGNFFTNSVTATMASDGAILPVIVQDSAGNTLAGSISMIVESTNVVNSGVLQLVVYAEPFSFMAIEQATGMVLLQQTTNLFTIGSSTYGVSQATNIVITPTTLDADLVLAGSSATGHITFNFIQPGMIQTTLSSSNNSPGQIFQQFADQGEDIFGGFECTPNGSLSARNFSAQLAGCLNIAPLTSCGGHAPFYLTTRHYGIYAETDALGTLTFAQGGYTSFSFSVPQLTYDIIYGINYATIMAGFNSRSGEAYMPPIWAFDSIWWKDDDHDNLPAGVTNAQGNVLDTASKLALYQIHASSEWVDRPYGSSCGQGDGGWGNMDWDMSNGGFNNPSQMISTLQAEGINTMLWISDLCWCDLYNEALADGYLFYTNDNSTVNLQNTNAFVWFQTNLNNYVNYGIKGYKIDRGDQGEMPDSVNNRNDTLFQQLAMQGISAVHPNDSFVFSRTASDTGRRYSALWNGDTASSFLGLQYSVISGMRAGIINFPMWGSDTGGYTGIPTEELFDRWFEFSAYCSIMEVLHGGGRTPWYNYSTNFSSPTNIVAIAAAQAAAHHDLIPYSRSWMYQATQTGMPVRCPIMFGYPNDTNETATITNCEYLFGPNILAAPIITAGATSRAVYLPADHWLDYNTKSNLYVGSTNLTVPAPIQTIPLFVREGAIIPRGDILKGNNTWTTNWSPSLRIEFFPSDEFDSTFPYYTGSSVQTISCSNRNQSRVIQFGDLGNSGVLQIYVKNPGTVILNGTNLNLGTDYSYNPTNNLLQIPFAGATIVVVNNSTSLFSTLCPSSPQLTTIALNGTWLSLSATNGTPSGSWELLQSTNVALPLSQWQTNLMGNFDGSGNLSTNIANAATNLQEFYILKVQ
jgi:alpha-D-xyloside xylohydrolase